MKIFVITSQYPTPDSPYRHMFVHSRCKWYKRHGHDVVTLVPANTSHRYEYEGVDVYEGPADVLTKKLKEADVVCFHLLLHRFDKNVDGGVIYNHVLADEIPTLFFIHGVETQKIWKSRKGDVKWRRPVTVARMLYRDFYLIERMKKTLKDFLAAKHCVFVAPSKWMFEESQETTGIPIINKGKVIPNGIDTGLFRFTDRWEQRNKVMVIRPLTMQAKYANDLFVQIADRLPANFEAHLYGDGNDKDVRRIETMVANAKAEGLRLNRGFLDNAKIPELHQQHGIYAAVTRMDAQGVSMCEAMASGLPVVSFDITAIGEFVKHGETGMLVQPYDCQQFADYIAELSENRSLFDNLTQNARQAMEAIDVAKTTLAEVELAKKLAAQ